MEKDPAPTGEQINIDELTSLIKKLLQESAEYNVDCVDLEEGIIDVVTKWFEDNKSELRENFKESHPQTFPPKQELIDRIREVFQLERIKDTGSEPEFRRTKIIDHWVGQIYEKILSKIFND